MHQPFPHSHLDEKPFQCRINLIEPKLWIFPRKVFQLDEPSPGLFFISSHMELGSCSMTFSSGLELVWVTFQGLAWKQRNVFREKKNPLLDTIVTGDRVWESPGWHHCDIETGFGSVTSGISAFDWLKSHSSHFFSEKLELHCHQQVQNIQTAFHIQQPIFQQDLKRGGWRP